MNLTLKLLMLVILASCSNQPEGGSIDSANESKSVESIEILIDTLNSSFPVQIGNDKGAVNVVGIRTYENQSLTNSDFTISLNGIPNFSISTHLDKSILIDSNEIVLLKDTVNSDYLNSAVLKNVEFDFVRANTLYFIAILENPIDEKEIIGRFNWFYRTKKKGTVYGWITDEIKETLPNIK